ncbi:MAG TPA: AAA family ATPase, partial [Bacillota bacterium]|nr:AAA family ATPase [Bacillota bacterium]
EGELLAPGGSLTGGSHQHKGANLLGRSREMDELSETLQQLTETMEKLRADETKQAELVQQAKAQLEQQIQTIQQGRITLAELERDIAQGRQEVERLEKTLELQQWEESQVAEEITTAIKRQQELEELLAGQEVTLAQAQEDVAGKQEEARKSGEGKQALQEEVTGLKVQLAALKQEEQGLKQSLNRYNQSKKGLNQEIKQKESSIREMQKRQQELTEEIDLLQKSISEQVLKLAQENEQLAAERQARTELGGSLADMERQIRQRQQEQARVQQELHTAELRQTRLETEVEAGVNRLWEEYQLTFEQALLEKQEIPNRRTVVSRINELKTNINALGVVNLGAIEEYARVKERYEFLQRQYKDLDQAKAGLFQVIDEINQIMTSRFSEAFRAINGHFNDVFQKLFGGGRAELILTDANNLLETGLDIMAQPPGKKPQHLSLLSGGERALTAIALLFAILTVKPSPFCVLDEIEASLDEANVRRFADYVKEFSQATQFIVVTHRKGTMEVADALYGITMDETGVSKVVSMKFSEKVS